MDGIHWLAGQGVTSFLQPGPDGVLSAITQTCLDRRDAQEPGAPGAVDGDRIAGSDAGPVLTVPALRGGERPEAQALINAVGELWVRGVQVDWGALFTGSGAQRVGLPTYAFQRERYWLHTQTRAGNMTSAGQASADHPMLGAAVTLAGGEGWLFTGRLSLASHPWLADHALMGVVLLPGSAFLELALHACRQVGCEAVGELTFEAPLMLGEQTAVQLQVAVGEPDETHSGR